MWGFVWALVEATLATLLAELIKSLREIVSLEPDGRTGKIPTLVPPLTSPTSLTSPTTPDMIDMITSGRMDGFPWSSPARDVALLSIHPNPFTGVNLPARVLPSS